MTQTEREILEQLPAVPLPELRVVSWVSEDELLEQLPAIARLEGARAC